MLPRPFAPRPCIESGVSNDSSCRPKAFRRTDMSSSESDNVWSWNLNGQGDYRFGDGWMTFAGLSANHHMVLKESRRVLGDGVKLLAQGGKRSAVNRVGVAHGHDVPGRLRRREDADPHKGFMRGSLTPST